MLHNVPITRSTPTTTGYADVCRVRSFQSGLGGEILWGLAWGVEDRSCGIILNQLPSGSAELKHGPQPRCQLAWLDEFLNIWCSPSCSTSSFPSDTTFNPHWNPHWGPPWFVVPQGSPGIAPAGLVLRRERWRRKEALAERDADGGGAAAATHGRNGRSGGEWRKPGVMVSNS